MAMNLTFRQLRVFESVARHQSFTRAAEELFLTQPAVSMQIKQLEEQVGLPLFEQLGKKIFLTHAGKELYQYSRQVSASLNEFQGVVDDLKGSRRGRLDIAVASTANSFATRLLAVFSKRFELLTYRLEVTNRQTLLEQLDANTKDLVIMGRPPEELDLVAEPFMENPLVIIAPVDHPLVGRKAIPLQELQSAPFVLREEGSGTRGAMERFFAERGVMLKVSMEMTSNEAIKQAVQAGLGLGIVSIHTLELELAAERLVILDVESFPILRHWYVVHRKGKRLSSVAQAFKTFVLTEAVPLLKVRVPENA